MKSQFYFDGNFGPFSLPTTLNSVMKSFSAEPRVFSYVQNRISRLTTLSKACESAIKIQAWELGSLELPKLEDGQTYKSYD